MKAKALLTAVLLAATNFAWAQGGLGIGQVEKHMDADNWVQTEAGRDYIMTKGPIDKFEVEAPRVIVDTDQFKNSNNGRV